MDSQELFKRYQDGKRNFEGINMRGAPLNGFDLREARLRNADLRDADLGDANLSQADLQGANLQGANLRNACLKDADLRLVDLGGADLRGASLEGVDLRGANLSETVVDKNAEMAATWRQVWDLVNRKGKKQVNRLEIKAQIISERGAWVELLFDDEPLAGPGLGIDLYQLALSLQGSGEYWIMTCSCGHSGCAGITQGVHVFWDGNQVQWVMLQPEPARAVVFDGDAYREEIKQSLTEFLNCCREHPSEGIVPGLNYPLLQRTADLDKLLRGG